MTSTDQYYTAQWLQEDFPERFELFYRTMYQRLYSMACNILMSEALAEDAVQEVFTMLWDKGSRMNPQIKLEPYMLGSLRNQCLNHFRMLHISARYKSYLTAFGALISQPHESYDQNIEAKVQKVLAQLPDMQRRVIEMSMIRGMRYQDIARELNIAEGTVHTHLKRAYKYVRDHFVFILLFGLMLVC